MTKGLFNIQQAEKLWKQTVLTFKWYMCICTHSRTADKTCKMTVKGVDICRLPTFR